MARRNKPHDPAAAMRAAMERREREEEAARLRSQGATVTQDRAGKIISAYRSNCFNVLLRSKVINQNQFNAAHTLSVEWATWKGLDGAGDRPAEIVDGGSGCAELVTDRMIQAGRRVASTLAQVGPMDRALLETLMEATVEHDRPGVWQVLVRAIAGVEEPRRASQVVACALENLRLVYEAPRQRHAA